MEIFVSAQHLSKKPHSMVTFLIKVRRSYRDLSSQADPARELEVLHVSIKTDVSR